MPLVLARLIYRGHREPGYRQHIGERFGFYHDEKSVSTTIWVHAVSVGETRAAEPLIRKLIQQYPQHRILLTHMTATGRETGSILFQEEINRKIILQCFLPYDIPLLVRRLLNHFNPAICILMETEVWPNLIYTCHRQSIPVALVNARLSPKSFRKAQRMSGLIRPAAETLTCVAAQTKADANRIRELGATNVLVTGNSKFDVTVGSDKITSGEQLREQWGNRPVLLCASTREGEEQLILDAFLNNIQDNLLLIIVPRHPQRFDLVEQLIQQLGLVVRRKSALMRSAVPPEVRVILGDTMGELPSYYVSCDIAFIGGSLLPLGGQNLIEACAVGRPVILGPHTFNFDTISTDAIDAGAALRVNNADELFQLTTMLFNDSPRRSAMGQQAYSFAAQHRGATARTVAILQEYISAKEY